MVTPSFVFVCTLLAQDAGAPPARFAEPPSAVASPAPSSRRPRMNAGDVPPAEVPTAPPFRATPAGREADPVEALPDEALPPATAAASRAEFEAQPNEAASELSGREPATLPAHEHPPGTRLEAASEAPEAGSPAAVLADALAIQAQLEVTGKPLTLVEMLGRIPDPRARLSAIDAYWGVALAWIEAHWEWSDHDSVGRMEAMSPPAADEVQQLAREAKFRARLAATLANWKQAEVELVEAQQRLAVLLRMAPSEPLPVAADLPHVGSYKTRFETLYATQPAPERSLSIHRTLPLRERELRTRAEAVDAAHQALEAAEVGLQEGTVSLETLFSCLDDQKRERQAFLNVVHRYNVDIAEYALATPLPAADDRILAARLIKLRRDEGARLETRDPAVPAAATGAPAAPIAVAPPEAASFEQPATHRQPRRAEFEMAEDPQPPVQTGRPRQRGVPAQAPPIERGEE